MYIMFYICSSLTSINLSSFDTQNVNNMRGMFYNCSSLTSINLSNFNTQNVKDMNMLFYGCLSLKYIDISSFVFENKTSLFNYLPDGCTITVNKNSDQNLIDIPQKCQIN